MTVEQLEAAKVVAILRGIAPEALFATVDALMAGGVRAVEVTFNTPGAPEMVARLAKAYAGRLYVGAGTVLDAAGARVAVGAGASFVLAPTLDEGMVRTCAEAGAVAVPGVMTPTELVTARRWGAPIVKVFPAVTVGTAFFRQVLGPLADARMMAVGGVTRANFRDFLAAGATCVGVGGGIADPKKIAAGDFAGVTADARGFFEE